MASLTQRMIRRSKRAVAEVGPRLGVWSVRAENERLGTDEWRLADPGPEPAIEGFADRVSVVAGEPVRLLISTTSRRYRVVAYRMGWYRGKQGREVWRSDWLAGERQPGPWLVGEVNLVMAPWSPSLTVSTKGWPEGCYLLKLISEDGHDRWITLTVRSASARDRTVFVNAVTTWVAYNRWGGGYNVYAGPDGAPEDYERRSRKVSFDRPYDKNGSYFTWYELPALSLAEKMGLPLAYATDLELDSRPELFEGARALIFAGHDEYWTAGMRATVLAARDAGTNLAFFGANTAYRRVRLEPSPLGEARVMVCYKNAEEDPAKGTHQWRLPPDPQPESELTGVLYECNPVNAPYVVVEPDCWIFEGTGAKLGSAYPGLVQVEYDKLLEDMPVPRPLQVLSDSPLTCRGVRTWANSCYYTVPSGAGVFSSGTLGWTPILPLGDAADRAVPRTAKFVLRATRTILR